MPTYAEALAELETILRALETDTVDVDDLTSRVERSAELIRLCRHKLRHAEASLDRVFDNLDDEEDSEEEEEPIEPESDDEDEDDEGEEEDDEDEDEDEDDEEDDDDRDQAGGAGRPNQSTWLF